MTDSVILLQNIVKNYDHRNGLVHVLQGIDFELKQGEMVALMGPSGSGKSSLLHILGLLDGFQEGRYQLLDRDVKNLNDQERTKLRSQDIGFVYQFHHLLPEFSALENIAMPLLLAGHKLADITPRALQLLGILGMSHRASHRPHELSGGEQQRVAILRAFIHRPKLVLADEPTGNLDNITAGLVFDEFRHLAKAEKTSILIATHDPAIAKATDRIVRLDKGSLA